MHIGKTNVWLIQLALFAVGMGLMSDSARGGPPTGKRPGLHIKQNSSINFRSSSYHVMNDSAGNRWDIQYYGSVYRGTSYSYSGGMYLQVGGSQFQTPNYQGWTNKEGELELGPWKRNNLTIYRRIKAYKDHPIARWLEILENPTGSAIKVQVAIYTNVRYSVSQSKTSSGQRTFGAKDWAIWTKGSSSRSTPTLHVVTSPDAKIRPTVSVSSSQIYTRYNLTIPAGKTVVLCHFEAQNRNTAELEKMMKKFPTKALLKDLPGSVRKMILNIRAGGWVEGVDLDRREKSDRVVLANGDLMLGTVGNKSFKISTLLGEMELPAAQLLGMAVGDKGQLRFVLTNGQVIGGIAKGVKLDLALPSGGKLNIPIEKVKQWSFRISKEKPDDLAELGPYVSFDTGDMLAIKTGEGTMKLRFQAKYGTLELAPAELLEIARNEKKGAKSAYIVSFIDGSRVSGNFESKKLALQLKLGNRSVDVPRDKVALMFFSDEDKPSGKACELLLNNTDKLMGLLSDKGYRLTTDFGEARIAFDKFRKITFKKPKADAPVLATVEMLNGTVLRGRLDKDKIGFKVGAEIRLSIPTGMVTSLTRPEPTGDSDDKAKPPPGVQPVPPIPIRPPVRVLNARRQAFRFERLDRD
jgi:hypothetical protein